MTEVELLILSAGQTILVFIFIAVGAVLSWSLFFCELFMKRFNFRFDLVSAYSESKDKIVHWTDHSPFMGQFVRLIASPDDLKRMEQKRMANRGF